MRYDVFNGDADGLCALQQLRLASPAAARIVTGTKRDVHLLARVDARAGDEITVLDVSVAANREALDACLAAGAHVRWFDHHQAGDVPQHPAFESHLDPHPHICTSLIVDRHLGGRHRPWAIVAAFGDNLHGEAERLARAGGYAEIEVDTLRRLGEALNYNAYGETAADVLIHPRDLYLRLRRHADPFEFRASDPIVASLVQRRRDDLAEAARVAPAVDEARLRVVDLPDAPWSRRVIGSFAHRLAAAEPQRAHAVLRARSHGSFVVSLRAPLATPRGADRLCLRFGGGGRAAAAGIDALPERRREEFIAALREADWQT